MQHKAKGNQAPQSRNHHRRTAGSSPHNAQLSSEDRSRKDPSKRAKKTFDDDTPRAFTRLINNTYRTPRSGEDDGRRPTKRQIKSHQKETAPKIDPSKPSVADTKDSAGFEPNELDLSQDTPDTRLKIQRHEPLSHFSARVDAALPFSSLAKSRPSATLAAELKSAGLKNRRTRLERRMQKMQQAWRVEDQKIKERLQNLRAERNTDLMVDEEGFEEVEPDAARRNDKKGKKRRRRKVVVPEQADVMRDLENDGGGLRQKARYGKSQVEVEGRRLQDESIGRGLVGLHDVVQRPPKLVQVKERGSKAENSPFMGDGGLKKKEELSRSRAQVIKAYRMMMKKNARGLH